MNNKECAKKVGELQEEALTINDSINWAAERAYHCFDQYEKMENCSTLECERERAVLLAEAEKFKSKIEYENKALDNYSNKLEEALDSCPECFTGDFHF